MLGRRAQFLGETLDVPDGCHSLTTGCGWSSKKDLDIDFSAIMYGASNEPLHQVDYRVHEAPGMRHSGDDRNGQQDGDDEAIVFNLLQVPQAVQEIFLCVTIFTEKVFFEDVEGIHCHLQWPGLDRNFAVAASPKTNGFVFGSFRRQGGSKWVFQTMGASRDKCLSWHDLKETMIRLRGESTVMARSAPSVAWKVDRLTVPFGVNTVSFSTGWTNRRDVDMAALMFDSDGREEVHAIDFKVQSAPGMILDTDDRKGKAHGDCETITINLSQVPAKVSDVFVVVSVFDAKCGFDTVSGGFGRIAFDSSEAGRYPLPSSTANGFIFARMTRSGRQWTIETLGQFVTGCIGWLEFKTDINVIRGVSGVTSTRRSIQVWHPVKLEVPAGENAVQVGCGWDYSGDVDVDFSAIMFDANGDNPVHSVDYKQKKCPGAVHSGDDRSGEGDGDDEAIVLSLNEVPAAVEAIFFTVTIFTDGFKFDDLGQTYCRLCFGEKEVGKYQINEPGTKNGYVFGQLQRKGKTWEFSSVNTSRAGCISWNDLKDDIKRMRATSKAEKRKASGATTTPPSAKKPKVEGAAAGKARR